jgi:hypothetical protein
MLINKSFRTALIPLILVLITLATSAQSTPINTYILGGIGPSGSGNVVAYVDGSGLHGLETKATDEPSEMNWTDAKTAAEAHNKEGSIGTCTSNCWHLPTKTELELLFEQQTIIGGFSTSVYWSSTEIRGTNDAADQSFSAGAQSNNDKGNTLKVRAVRMF